MLVHKEINKLHRILVMTAVEAERDAVLRGLRQSNAPTDVFEVCTAGVGPVSAAVSTASILAASNYDLVISAGIGGGFPEQAGIGDIVIASSVIAADLGAEAPEQPNGFTSVDELGFGKSLVPVHNELSSRLVHHIESEGIPVCLGPILTLSTATGTAHTAQVLSLRVPGAAAEAMEGYGVALAAHKLGIPVMEIRAISNLVGPRQRELWKIGEALAALEQACSKLPELLSEVAAS